MCAGVLNNVGKKIIGEGSTENKVLRLANHVAGLETDGGYRFKHFDLEPRLYADTSYVLKDTHYLLSQETKKPLVMRDVFGKIVDDESLNDENNSKKYLRAMINTEFYLIADLKSSADFKDMLKLQGLRLEIELGWPSYKQIDGVRVIDPWDYGGNTILIETVNCDVLGVTQINDRLFIKGCKTSEVRFPAFYNLGHCPVVVHLGWDLTGYEFQNYMKKIRWEDNGINLAFRSHGWSDKHGAKPYFTLSILDYEIIEIESELELDIDEYKI